MRKEDKRRYDDNEEDLKKETRYRLLSELERYEIFNTEEAEKYDTQQDLDFIIDEEGNIQFIVAAIYGNRGLFGGKEYVEIPWEFVTKVGTNVIVVSADKDKLKRTRG